MAEFTSEQQEGGYPPRPPGATIDNQTPGGGFFLTGRLENNQFSGGTLLNQSGICGDELLAKYRTAPIGWWETTGYHERFTDDHSQIERVFEGPWGLRPQFIAWSLGYSYSLPDPNNPLRGILKREIPVMDCEFPWLYASDYELVEGQGAWVNNYFQAKDCQGRPILEGTRPIYFPKIGYISKDWTLDKLSARVKLTFTARDFEFRTDANTDALGKGELSRYVTRQRFYAVDAIPFSAGLLKFTEGPYAGRTIDENAGRLIVPKHGWRYIFHEVPDPNEDAIRECAGKINTDVFDGARGAPLHPPETLLCQAPITERYRTRVGRVAWRVTIPFLESPSPKGWNAFAAIGPNQDGRYYRAAINGDPTRKVYETTGAFPDLFTVPAPVQYQ